MYDRGYIMNEVEQKELLNWLDKEKHLLTPFKENILSCSFKTNDNNIHKLIWDIRNRIIEKENLQLYTDRFDNRKMAIFFYGFREEPHIYDKGSYENQILYIKPAGKICSHLDKNIFGLIHARFNVYLQAPEEGATYYDGDVVEVKERGYVMCRSGLDYHWTDPVGGEKPRISISYGFQMPIEKVNELYKPPENRKVHIIYKAKKWVVDYFERLLNMG